jgi:hypothetical protein
MRSHIESRRPRLARYRALAGAAVLLTEISLGAAGCASAPTPAPAFSAPPASTIAPPAATPTMVMSKPVRVRIPTIGVDSKLMDLTLNTDGTMNVPPDGTEAGWYTGAPTPGELGPAIIAGHVDWGGHEGVFYHLRNLKPNEQVTVSRQDGSTAVFQVTAVEEFPKNKFPTDLVYGDINYAGLRLITCGGSFDRGAHSYNDNIVVFAHLMTT